MLLPMRLSVFKVGFGGCRISPLSESSNRWMVLVAAAASTQRPPDGCGQALPFRGHAEDVLQVVASWDQAFA